MGISIKKIVKVLKRPGLVLDRLLLLYGGRLDDEFYLKARHKLRTGHKLNLTNPQTYTDKLNWEKLNVRKDIYTSYVDKYEVKKIIEEMGIDGIKIVPTYGIYNSFDEINFDVLPNSFVLKCTHDSGSALICKNKAEFDYAHAKKFLTKRLKDNFFSISREWPYKNVKPRIICEEYIENLSNNNFKFFCYNGIAKYMYYSKFRSTQFDFRDMDWNHLEIGNINHTGSVLLPEKPARFSDMIRIAEKISSGIPHVRIDLYSVDDDIYFGEMTFFHEGGLTRFEPDEWNYKFAEDFKLAK